MRIILLLLFTFSFFLTYSQKTPFTSQDALNVKRFSYVAMTDDGLWVAGGIRSQMDRMDVDHFRFGDPSYIAPYTQELILINSQTGEKRSVTPAKSIIAALQFSPDGKNLGYLKYEGGNFKLYVYSLATGKSELVNLKDVRNISSSNALLWTKNNKSLILSVRANDWLKRGDSLYREATIGPITVYDGNKPLLKWEEIREHASLTQVVKVDVRSGQVTDLLPESRYDDFNLTENGKMLTFVEFKPKKTAYKRKGGMDYSLYAISLNNPSERDTLIAPAEKRINISWDESKTNFAFADSSHIFVQSIGQSKAMKVS